MWRRSTVTVKTNTRRCPMTCAARSPTNGGTASRPGSIPKETFHRRFRAVAHGDAHESTNRRFERCRRYLADRHAAFTMRIATVADEPLRPARLELANGRYRNRSDFAESRN